MTREEKINLIKRYAPIFWMHEDDAFLPEDCAVMGNLAKVGTSPKNLKSFKLDELGALKDSKKYYMDIPEVDFNNFGINSNYAGPETGPNGVSAHLREKFSNNKFLYPKARPSLPKYHARASEISITDKGDSDSRALRSADPEAFGDYYVVQFYYFFLFNDSWNQHISDWDSTLEVFIKKDNSRTYVIVDMHHISWLVRCGDKPQELKKWIDDWQNVERKKKMGWCFQIGGHPFIFIAEGAHGGYPTPGFSIHGAKIFNKKIIGQTDYRQIGRLCIYPDYEPVNKDAVVRILKEAEADTSKTRFLPWGDPVILTDQTWLKYKGLWGTRSDYEGWGGSPGPAQKKSWRMDQRRFKREFAKAIKGNYTGDWPYKILLNWHGWREVG